MATLKLMLGLGVMAAVVVLGIKFVPVYLSNYEFEDFMKEEALHATYSTRSEEDIRDTVVKHARDYDINLAPKQVRVSRTGAYGNGSVTIAVEYSVPVNLPGYAMTLDFHPSSQNRGVF
jgi:hypothetical protein